MRASFYNQIYDINENLSIFFNYFTLALVALKQSDARLGRKILADPDGSAKARGAKRLIKLFKDNGFLVADGADEREFLRKQNASAREHSDTLNLTIVPTLDCNFRCRYCYQEKVAEAMTPEVEAALGRYVEDNLEGMKQFHVTWFGGEPLLRLDIIERLSAQFQRLSAARSVKYTAGIVTNGYLLDDSVSERLARCGVVDAQITVDGPADVHDRRRPLKGNGPTFEKIMANIPKAAARQKIQLRMNVDDENRGRIGEMLDILENAGIRESVGFYLGQTYPYTEVCQDVAALCLKDDDFSLLEIETSLEMSRRGFPSHPVPKGKSVYCMAESPRAFAVTPTGGLVKCWNDVANPAALVGHLLLPETEAMRTNLRGWLGRDVFGGDCRDCLALPICMGGCPYLHRQTGSPHCIDWKHHPEECLVFYYYLRKREQETGIIHQFWEGLEQARKRGSPDESPTTPGPGESNARRRIES